MRFNDVILLQGRALEWFTSLGLMLFAFTLWLPGDTLSSPTFKGFSEFGVTEMTLVLPLAIIAAMRMAALLINGMWRRSPILRMIGAIVGLMCFACLAMMVGWPYFTGQTQALSTGFFTYLLWALADFIAAYRSGADVGTTSKRK